MQVTVFGAGGATGKLIVDEAVSRGHDVIAFLRSGTLSLTAPNLRIVHGDATDPQAVAAATAAADAVVNAIGGSSGIGPTTQITDCARTIVPALQGRDPSVRYVAISSVGAGDSGALMPLAARPVLLLLRPTIKDHNGAEEAVMGSDLRWTIARCVGLTNDPPRGHANASTERVGGARIPRADVAAWIVDQLDSDEYDRQAVALW